MINQSDPPQAPGATTTLCSLDRFLDVVFALVFFRILEFLPQFADKHWTRLPLALFSLLASEPAMLTRVVFGCIMIVYYWSRKNALLAVIEKSNSVFAALSIASLFFMCLFTYALVADPMDVGGPPTLLLQSGSLLMASLLGYLALRYAVRAGLTRRDQTPTVERMIRIDLSNPLTAAVATALSWSSLAIWTLSWFICMPVLGALLTRRTPRSSQ